MLLEWVSNAIFWLLDNVLQVIEYLVKLFPDMPAGFSMLPDNMGTYIGWVGNLINVDALAFVIGVFITYELAMISVRVFLFIWRLTPFS